jgi:hypothetical protein
MFRVGVSAVVAGVILATLSGCDQSTAADPDYDRPHYSSTLTEIKPKHGTNHLILGRCRPMDAPNHTTVCVETHLLNVKKCGTSHPRHGVVCVKPRRSN